MDAAPLTLRAGPRLGPHCPFTGRMVRPLSQRVALLACETALALGQVLVGLFLLESWLGPAGGLLGGVGLALCLALTWVEPRARAIGLGVSALLFAGSAWRALGTGRALDGTGLDGWSGRVVAELQRADEALEQVLGTGAFPVLAATLAVLSAALLAIELAASWRVRDLPQRLWFARFHPVWGRPYAPRESAHPWLAVLAVDRDPVLAEKLVFLGLSPGANSLRIAAQPALGQRGAGLHVPLAGLAEPLVLWVEGAAVYQRGELGPASGAELRFLLHRPFVAPPSRVPEWVPSSTAELPLLDYFAADDGLFAKRYGRAPSQRLFGLLFDSRPTSPEAGGVPRFTALLLVDGRPQVERPHADLLGAPRYDPEQQRWWIHWRQGAEDPLRLELERGRDQVVFVNGREGPYYLYFAAFGGPPR